MFHGIILISVHFAVAFSWGFRGHIAISKIAYSMLHESTISYMSRIMGKPVGITEFAEMSVWADRVSRTGAYDWTKDLHFTRKGNSLPDFVMQQDPDCLLSSVNHFAGILLDTSDDIRSKKVPDEDALRFLIHFTGDLHAPFHIGDAEDLNGGSILVYDPLACLVERKEPAVPSVSLHRIWDSHILKLHEDRTKKKLDEIVNNLIASNQRGKISGLRGRFHRLRENESLPELCLRTAVQSRAITKDVGLLDAQGNPIVSGAHLSWAYFDRACPVAIEALNEAGVNLASILNRIADAKTP